MVTIVGGVIELRAKGLRSRETVDVAWCYYAAVKQRVMAERAERKKGRAGRRRSRLTWDVGCNDGAYARIAAESFTLDLRFDGAHLVSGWPIRLQIGNLGPGGFYQFVDPLRVRAKPDEERIGFIWLRFKATAGAGSIGRAARLAQLVEQADV